MTTKNGLVQNLLYKLIYTNLLARPIVEHGDHDNIIYTLIYKMIDINLQARPILEHG